ncbi:hypothetical protein SELMODRAFT_438100 [Selaginella moellendorffii]|uniref:LysM domain-containing protein n=1 Tax=Selaginella moellendorffii TaxID=88036 RepID=D8QU39_SELML|nr:hypothetical protein SELMODRAFT_438100 [Selaginella moellendorffii]
MALLSRLNFSLLASSLACMSAPGNNKSNGTDKDPNEDKTDYTIAKAAGAVIATGIAWTVFKTFWPKKADEEYERYSEGVSSFESEAQEKTEGFADRAASTISKKFPKFSRKHKSGAYEVCPGDTLYGLSRKYGVTVESIKAANGIHNDIIVVGDKLDIPSY